MFGFLLGCLTIYIGYRAFQRFDSNNPAKLEKQNEAKLLSFAKHSESQEVFQESIALLDDLITRANKESNFGNIYHTETFEKTVYQYKITVDISPTTLTWKVRDLSQSERLKSHQTYTLTYDRSRKVVTYDEMRINEGSTYSWGSLLSLDETYRVLPTSLVDQLTRLNQAGWNTGKVIASSASNQSLAHSTHPTSTTIRQLLLENEADMDPSIVKTIEDILSLSQKIMDEEEASDNVEFQHNMNRLLEEEIPSIVRIYIDLDDKRKEEVKEMTQDALGKAYNHLSSMYDSYQKQKVAQLKQTHLVMEERYD